MRWLRDIAAVLMLAALAGLYFLYAQQTSEHDQQTAHVRAQLDRLTREITVRAATETVPVNARGWPVVIDPNWFHTNLPTNTLVSDKRPWIELANEEQANLLHPPVRMCIDESIASFWYNPYQGIVRARVPIMVSDAAALDLYNDINQTNLASIFATPSDSQLIAPSPDTADTSDNAAPDQIEEPDLDPTKPREAATETAEVPTTP